MNKINLTSLELKTFTEQDALDYCQLNNIKLYNIAKLDLGNNKLTDISGIKLFKNIRFLYLDNNELTNIHVLKDLKNLKELYLNDNELTDISVLKDLNKLETLILNNNQLTDVSVLQNLNKLEILNINYLELESNQIIYIKSLKNLKFLGCINGFKDMSVINQLPNNIEINK